MLAFLIAFSCVLTACTPRRGTASSDSSSNPLKGADASGDTRLNVVTTLFPYYDFLRQIAGDSIRLTMVVPAGMDSHSFEPTPADMITIQNADLLVCNGGTMEQWLSQVLDSFGEGTGPKRVVTMMDCVDVVQEEIVEGMEEGETPLTELQVGKLIHIGNLPQIKDAIFAAFVYSTNGGEEKEAADEETTEEGNRVAVQDE